MRVIDPPVHVDDADVVEVFMPGETPGDVLGIEGGAAVSAVESPSLSKGVVAGAS